MFNHIDLSLPSLDRETIDGVRYYKVPNDEELIRLVSITSVTSHFNKEIFIKWRKRVGEEEANRITKKSTDIGSMVHESLELFLNGRDWDNFSEDPNDLIAKKITTKFINTGLNSITEVWGLEIGLILEGLYAGTADCVGKINGVPSIIDFKTSRKMKRREWIEDYFLQGCAYANAHNVMFGTEIQQVVILMVDRELLFQEFTVRPTEFNILTKVWKKRLIDFHKKYS